MDFRPTNAYMCASMWIKNSLAAMLANNRSVGTPPILKNSLDPGNETGKELHSVFENQNRHPQEFKNGSILAQHKRK